MYRKRFISSLPLAALLALGLASSTPDHADRSSAITSYIVQGTDYHELLAAVEAAGGEVTHELPVIDALGVRLTAEEVNVLKEYYPALRLHANAVAEAAARKQKERAPVEATSDPEPEPTTDEVPGDAFSHYPALIGADRLHAQGITGNGVGVAVIDSGIYTGPGLSGNTNGKFRIKAAYDARTDRLTTGSYNKRRGYSGMEEFDNDDSGHGSHVASAGFNSKLSNAGKYNGIAPDVDLVSVKVFDAEGRGTYADVIRGVQWAIDNAATWNIRVINMSLSAAPQSHYWEDPLNQAVMAAWDAGIVVVASAGNTGPEAQTIGVPGNVPYVITVGAMTDNDTPADPTDDRLARFSSAGPTFEGFVKPEVVAPGGHIMAAMEGDSQIALTHPEFYNGASFFSMSGTSQAAAIVSGIAALVLQAEPGLTPDQVKCKIMSSARPALDDDGTLAYSIFQQGAGLANAHDAVYASNYDCANNGLDVKADLDGSMHFGGPANQNEEDDFYLMDMDGYLWRNGGVSGQGYLWSNGYLWRNGYLWSAGYLWTNSVNADGYLWRNSFAESSGYLWRNGYLWSNGYLWRNSEIASINSWVEQE
ncbi:MAG: S8 family peptidase [Gammaproteobacteria bacterium]|nr:S8 family peptidase [Gammaproteobacteria bacterium]NNF59718.1 S8 family peptidase [Gammaproteobacteria bacterium]